MKKISKQLLEEFLVLKIRKADITKKNGVEESELYKLEPEDKVMCKVNNTINLAKSFIDGRVDSEWMHEWIDMIVFSDWYKLYEYSNQEITDMMIDIHLCLDDEGDEFLGFSMDDLREKIEKLESLIIKE